MTSSIQQNHIEKIIRLPIRNINNKNKTFKEKKNKCHSLERRNNNKRRLSPRISTSYQHLLSQYSKSKERYNSVYNNKRKKGKSTFLERIYLKYQKNLEKYYKDSNNTKGLRLKGNKQYEKKPIENFIKEIDSYMEHIENKLKENNLYYLHPNDNNDLNERLRLTPIPTRNRILMNTNKEKEDFSNAERSAVLLRRVEYTHGLTTREGKNEFQKCLQKEREKIFFILKEAVLIIENWWIKIKGLKGNIRRKKIFMKNNYSRNDNSYNNNTDEDIYTSDNNNLNNLDIQSKKMNIVKIFFKQMEIFYYMKRLENERKKLYLEFMKRLRENKINFDKNHYKIESTSVKSPKRDNKPDSFYTYDNKRKNKRKIENSNVINILNDPYYYSTEEKNYNDENKNKLKTKIINKEKKLKEKYDIIVTSNNKEKEFERKGQKITLIDKKKKNKIPYGRIKNYYVIPFFNKTSRNNTNNNKEIEEKYKFILEKTKNSSNENTKNKKYKHRNNEKNSYQFKDVGELIKNGNFYSKDNVVKTEMNEKRKLENIKRKLNPKEQLFYNSKLLDESNSSKINSHNYTNQKSPNSIKAVKLFKRDMSHKKISIKKKNLKKNFSLKSINNDFYSNSDSKKKVNKSSSSRQISKTSYNINDNSSIKFEMNSERKEQSPKNNSIEQKSEINNNENVLENKTNNIKLNSNNINNNSESQKFPNSIGLKHISISIINNNLYENNNDLSKSNFHNSIKNNNTLKPNEKINNETIENNNLLSESKNDLLRKNNNKNNSIIRSNTSLNSNVNKINVFNDLNEKTSSLQIDKNNTIISFISSEKNKLSNDSNYLSKFLTKNNNKSHKLKSSKESKSFEIKSNEKEKEKFNLSTEEKIIKYVLTENNKSDSKNLDIPLFKKKESELSYYNDEENKDNDKLSNNINIKRSEDKDENIHNENNVEKENNISNEEKNEFKNDIEKGLKKDNELKSNEIIPNLEIIEDKTELNEEKKENTQIDIIENKNIDNEIKEDNNSNKETLNNNINTIEDNIKENIDNNYNPQKSESNSNKSLKIKNPEKEETIQFESDTINKDSSNYDNFEVPSNLIPQNLELPTDNEQLNETHEIKSLNYSGISNRKRKSKISYKKKIKEQELNLNSNSNLHNLLSENELNIDDDDFDIPQILVYEEFSNKINKNNYLKNDNNVISAGGNYFNSTFSIPNEKINLENNLSLNTFVKENNSTIIKTAKDNNNNLKFKNDKINLIEISEQNKLDNSKFSDNKLILQKNSHLTIFQNNNLTEKEKIEKFIDLLLINSKQEFFSKLVLNYLGKNKIIMQDEELIALLKLGKLNTYQRILNNSLKYTNVDYQNKEISFKDWVTKFVKNKKDLENEKELKKKYKIFLNVKKVLHKPEEGDLEDIDVLKKIPKGFVKSNELIDSIFEERKKYLSSEYSRNSENINQKKNLGYHSIDLYNYSDSFKKSKKKFLNLSFKKKRDNSKDIIIPKNMKIAYNLLKSNKEKIDYEVLREFKDDPEKF